MCFPGTSDHHRVTGDVSYLSSSFSPGVPQLPVDRLGNVYTTVSGTGPGLGVVDSDTNMGNRLAIAALHDRVAMMNAVDQTSPFCTSIILPD